MAARFPGGTQEFDSVGNLYVNVAAGGGSGGTSSAFGAPFPAIGTAAGFDGANGDMEPGNLDAAGNLLVNVAAGSVTVAPVESDTCSTNALVTVGTSSTQAIAANPSRKRLILQNVGTTVLYVLLGTGSASATSLTFILPAGGTSKDGSSIIIFDIMWQGAVQVASSAAGGLMTAQENT
jgi:hypothetical protein